MDCLKFLGGGGLYTDIFAPQYVVKQNKDAVNGDASEATIRCVTKSMNFAKSYQEYKRQK